MTLNQLIELTNKLASEVDAMRARVEEHHDDIRFYEEDHDIDLPSYAVEDAAALLEQAFDLLEQSEAELIDLQIERAA